MISSQQPLISLEHVSKKYCTGTQKNARKEFYALQDVSLTISNGEFVTIVGPSGCGKSTIINLIAGFEQPDNGVVQYNGMPVDKPGSDRLVIFQEHGLLPWLTVRQNVEFGLRIQKLNKHDRREKAMHYIQMVHLARFAHSYPFQLSGGMKQRTAIARALAMEPQVMLMDEPFSALDPRTRDLLHIELQELWLATKKTIVFVSHSVEEALRLSDRIIIMSSQPGRVRREMRINLPRPRDFFDPSLVKMRSTILEELTDELDKLARREGDENWLVKADSFGHRGITHLDSIMGSSNTNS